MLKRYSNLMLVLFVLTIAEPAYANCQVELKPTDGYRELSDKLKCVWDHVKRLERAREKVSKLTRTAVPKAGFATDKKSGLPILRGCPKTADLPNVFEVMLLPGTKFCRKDGSIWFRVTDWDRESVYSALSGNGSKNRCFTSSSVCIMKDGEEAFSLRIQLESVRGKDGKNYLVGSIRKKPREE